MDWTLANQIYYAEHNNEVPFVNQIRLPTFPTDDFLVPGVGLAGANNANNHQVFVPIHGKTTNFDLKKVTVKEIPTKIKLEQTGFGDSEAIQKVKDEVEKERDLKRKLLGDPVFNLMNSPKIKTAKLALVAKIEPKIKSQKGEGSSKVHIFKK